MKEITNREDISILITTFYKRIRKNELLGPIFNKHIPEDQWPDHLFKLTDFWETNLFGIAKFKGNPSQKHINVDKNSGYTISQVHFGEWLNLWYKTVDDLYEGELAFKAKNSARKMATGQFLVMWNHRPELKGE